MMTFDQAVELYEEHFHQCYPYAIGLGYPGKTDAENIAIIQKCLETNTPATPRADYQDGMLY